MVLWLAGSALAAGAAGAQTRTGTTLAQFLRIEPSARHAGMGNAGVAIDGGIASVYFNPGAIGPIVDPAVQFTHSAWFADISYNYVAGALPVRGLGTLFASVTALNSGDIDVRTVSEPLGTGERYSINNVALGFGYGRQITSRFGAGIQLNYVNETIWNSSSDLLTMSLGTVYTLTDNGIQLGASLTNLGTRGRFNGDDLIIQYDNDPDVFGDNSTLPGEQLTNKFAVPILFRVGLGFPYRTGENSRLLLVADALNPSDNSESVSAGAEWMLKETFAIRAGYQTLAQADAVLGLTLGVGIHGGISENRFSFDYAWADHEFLNGTHRLTFGMSF
jgi:hypothetical protein